MSWIWLIGGGIMQLPMLKEIKRRGYRVLVTDYDEQCRCSWLADAFFSISTYDEKEHIELAKLLKDRISIAGVLTVAADVGPTVSAVAEVLSLPSCSRKAAKRARDKIEMRIRTGFIRKHPIWYPVMERDLTSIWRDWDNFAKRNSIPSLPCVVKATDNRASRGMTVVKYPDQLIGAIAKAMQSSLSGNALIEEFLEGEEFAIDCFIVNGRASVVNIAKRKFYRPGVEAGHVNPGPFDPEMAQIATEYAQALGVHSGPFKLDLIKTERYGWCVLETATRLSGGFDHMYTAVMGPGKDITGLMLDYATGKGFDPQKAKATKNEFAACYAPQFKPGEIRGYLFDGRPELPEGIFVLNWKEIPEMIDSASRPVFVIETGRTEEEAWKAAEETASKLEPVYASA